MISKARRTKDGIGSRRPDTSGSSLALSTYTKLVRATESVTDRIHGHLNKERLTISQFGVLEALLHLGPLCQKDLAEKILKSTGNLTTVIDNLVKRGLVRRGPDRIDRRRYAIELTPSGQKLIARLFPLHAAAIARELSVLSPPDQRRLSDLLRRLGLGRS